MRFALAAAFAAALLAACSPDTGAFAAEPLQPVEKTSMPETAQPLPTLGPTELDLSKVVLAMRIPSAFRVSEKDASLTVSVLSRRLGQDSRVRLGVPIEEIFPLEATESIRSAFLSAGQREGLTIYAFVPRPEDRERLLWTSEEIARLKLEAPGQTELSFLAVLPGCWDGAMAVPENVARTLYIRLEPQSDFQVLIEEQILRQGSYKGRENYWSACED